MPSLSKRLRRLFTAQAHDAIDQLETPQGMSTQVLREIDEAIQHNRAGLVRAVAHVRQLDAERARIDSALAQARAEASAALAEHGREAATDAAARAVTLTASAEQLGRAVQAARAVEQRLREQLHALKAERLHAAGSQLRAAAMSSLVPAGNAPDAWTAAHERKQLLEACERTQASVLAQADAAGELLAEEPAWGGAIDTAEVNRLLDELERTAGAQEQ